MYKQDIALSNLQWLICHKNQPSQIIYIQYISINNLLTVLTLLPGTFAYSLSSRGCRYGTIVEMKEAVTKVIDTLIQEDFHGAFQKLLERYNCIAAGGYYFQGD